MASNENPQLQSLVGSFFFGELNENLILIIKDIISLQVWKETIKMLVPDSETL